MLRLCALALGPLLARAKRLGAGVTDQTNGIRLWLLGQEADSSGRLANALTRTIDRSWRALEIALGGDELVQAAGDITVDRALVEQLRQYTAAVPPPICDTTVRRRALAQIHFAREAWLIPGPLPTADGLASQVLRFLGGPEEETPAADAREIAAMAAEFPAEYPDLTAYLTSPAGPDNRPLLAVAIRYFFSREVASDADLLRGLRSNRTEAFEGTIRTGFDRLADALDRFSSIVTGLLQEMSATATQLPPPPRSTASETNFSIVGTHLVAPIQPGSDGGRISTCPVCLTLAAIEEGLGGWVAIRCSLCGTEFQASDGTGPPSPPPAAPRRPEPGFEAIMAKNLQAWKESGEPERWVAFRKGLWTDAEFRILCQMLRYSRFWPLDFNAVRAVLTELSMLARTKGTSWGMPLPPPPHPTPPSPSSLPSTLGMVHSTEVYRTLDGSLWVGCPLCTSFNVPVPARAAGVVSLTCPGCKRSFLAALKKRNPPASTPPPPPPPPPPSFWNKVGRWLGGG